MRLNKHSQYVKDVSLKQDHIASYDEFSLHLPMIQHLGRLTLHPNVTYINGHT